MHDDDGLRPPRRALVGAREQPHPPLRVENPHFAPLVLREMLDGHGPGRELILRGLTPLLEGVETFVAAAGQRIVREELPLRAALMETATAATVRAASGPLQQPLWGDSESLCKLAKVLILTDRGDSRNEEQEG